MSKRLDEARAKAAQIVAEAEAEEGLRLTLPIIGGMEEPFVHFPSKPEPWLSYKCRSVDDVLNVLTAFPSWHRCLRAAINGATHTDRATAVLAKMGDKPVPADQYVCKMMLTGGRGFGQLAEFVIHTEVDGRTVRVIAKLDSHSYSYEAPHRYPSALHVRSEVSYDRSGYCDRASHTPPRGLGDLSVTRYGTGSPDSYHFVYFWTSPDSFIRQMGEIK